jgi:hypothetical protein
MLCSIWVVGKGAVSTAQVRDFMYPGASSTRLTDEMGAMALTGVQRDTQHVTGQPRPRSVQISAAHPQQKRSSAQPRPMTRAPIAGSPGRPPRRLPHGVRAYRPTAGAQQLRSSTSARHC